MKIEELLKFGRMELEKNNIGDAFVISRLLVQHILKIDRNKLIIEREKEVEECKKEEYKNYIKEIVEGKPIQYITNNQEFMKLNFYVDKNVLIPQPDTETLVEKVLNMVDKNEKIKILDMCTGSGAIGVSLAYYLNKSQITLADISNEAIKVAKVNAKKNKVQERTRFIKTDMFENIKEKFDIIVSNPPYIKTNIIHTLEKQVQNEPHIALDGGEDGLEFYKILIEEAPKYLEKSGKLFLEIGYDQKQEVENLARQNGNYEKIETIKDLSQNDRVIILSC